MFVKEVRIVLHFHHFGIILVPNLPNFLLFCEGIVYIIFIVLSCFFILEEPSNGEERLRTAQNRSIELDLVHNY